MPETLETIDARRRRGIYRIVTESGTNYVVELHKSIAGGMRVISDGDVVRLVRQGIVGGCGEPDEPIIRLDRRMHLSDRGAHIVVTSQVRSILAVEDKTLTIDALLCTHCRTGYKPSGQPCAVCRH